MSAAVERPEQAFILRMSHGRNRITEAIANSELVLGWSKAPGLVEARDWQAFRQILKDTCFASDADLRRAGMAAGHAWRFLREMIPGSWVVVPRSSEFYVARVTGLPIYDPSRVGDDSAYYRTAVWLNAGRAIPRRLARAALQSRMKVQGCTAGASDLVADIAECLDLATKSEATRPTFATDLRARLISQTLDELRSGRIDSYGFERVIAAVLQATGGSAIRIIPRQLDKGADVVATFRVAGAFRLRVAVQAKHYGTRAAIGRDVVEQLLAGMDAEQADVGIVATSGTFSDEAAEFADQLEAAGRRVELVDGEQLAGLIVDCGLGAVDLRSQEQTDG